MEPNTKRGLGSIFKIRRADSARPIFNYERAQNFHARFAFSLK